MVITRGAVHQRADIEVEHHIVVNGVKLLRATNGRYFAESASQPDRLWFLTGFSCQCPAFVYRQTCRHHRALMVALGWTSDTPEPTPPASTACPTCNGSGTECSTVSSGRTWRYENVVCGSCHGSGEVAIAA